MIHFVIYEYLKKQLALMQNKRKNDEKTSFDFACFMLCGACSKTCATIVAYPHGKSIFDILCILCVLKYELLSNPQNHEILVDAP